MPIFKYKKEGQDGETQGSIARFPDIDKEKVFSMDVSKSADYRVRLMPPWSAAGAFAKGTVVHYGVGQEKKHVVCPNTIGKDLCPFCRLARSLKGDDQFLLDYNAIRPAYRYYSNVVDLSRPQNGVMVWSYGPTNYFALKKIQDDGDFGDLTDPENGHDIKISRQVQGKRINDAIYPQPKVTPIGDPDWLDQIIDLDSIIPDVDEKLVANLFKSQPWKSYETETTAMKVDMDDTDDIPEFTSEVESTQTGHEKAEAVGARLRAKLAAQAAGK